jgi:hypothetical protein
MKRLLDRFGRGKSVAAAHEPEPERAAGPVLELPVARFDKLSVAEVLDHLGELTPNDLIKLGEHERTHQKRAVVLADIDALLGNEPWPGYDALDVDGVRFGLDGATRERFVTVLAYERAHKNRAGVVLAAQQKSARRPA